MDYRSALVLTCSALMLAAQQENKDAVKTGHELRPDETAATPERINNLKVPAGFRISKFAEGLGNPRMIAVADDGAVYVTRRDSGDVVLLRDVDGDGRADGQNVVAKKDDLHGIAIHGNRVYLATVNEVFVADRKSDGSIGELRQIIGGLPPGGRHPNRTLAVGPDNMLYTTVGSTCNVCIEDNEETATILRSKLDGSGRTIFARGLRNTLGIAWHPETKELWGMDNGSDWLGDMKPKEELNRLVDGAHYGWPFVYNNGEPNRLVNLPKGTTYEQWAAKAKEPVLTHDAHAAPMQMVFYTGNQFPAEYRNNAFVAMRGSWNRKPPSGYEVVRIRFQNGKPTSIEPFLTRFLYQQGGDWAHFGRLVGVAMMRDGSLLIGDDTNGIIYRVSHEGQVRTRTP